MITASGMPSSTNGNNRVFVFWCKASRHEPAPCYAPNLKWHPLFLWMVADASRIPLSAPNLVMQEMAAICSDSAGLLIDGIVFRWQVPSVLVAETLSSFASCSGTPTKQLISTSNCEVLVHGKLTLSCTKYMAYFLCLQFLSKCYIYFFK